MSFERKLVLYRYPLFISFLQCLGWKQDPKRPFFAAYKRITNDGVCCHITPQFDFYNQTGNEAERLTNFAGYPNTLTVSHESASEGVHTGLSLLLDVESFEAMGGGPVSGQVGFKMALADARDVPFVKDQMSYIAPG